MAPITTSASFDGSRAGDFFVKRIADAAVDENILHQEDRDDSLFGVDPAVSGERSAVTERARREAGDRRFVRRTALPAESVAQRLAAGFVSPRHFGDRGLGHDAPSLINAAVENLTPYASPEAARDIARYDADGKFRPLKSAPTLIRGWEITLPDAAALQLALDFLYPAAVANWQRHADAPIPTLRETLNRQTGIYRVTALLRDDEATQLVADTCHDTKCLRRILWSGQPAPSPPPENEIPLLCTDACPILIGAARSAVKRRMKSEERPD